MAFSFSPEQREHLFAALGRSDSGAWHLTEDVELALDAYGRVELNSLAVGVAQSTVIEFEHLLAQASEFRAHLYGLPERLRQLAAMGAIGGDYALDAARLAQASGEALDRLTVKLAELGKPAAGALRGPHSMAEHFVHAVSQAFRNRMNIKPTSDAHGLFRRFLTALFDLVRRRHADLDDLSRDLTDDRLAQILEFGSK